MAVLGMNEGTQKYINFDLVGTVNTQVVGVSYGTITSVTNVGSINTIGTMPAISVGNATGGTLDLVKSGTVTRVEGGSIAVTAGTGIVTGGSIVVTAGTVVAGTVTNLVSGTINAATAVLNSGTINVATAVVSSGSVAVTAGTVVAGTLTNLVSGTINAATAVLNSGTINVATAVIPSGTVNILTNRATAFGTIKQSGPADFPCISIGYDYVTITVTNVAGVNAADHYSVKGKDENGQLILIPYVDSQGNFYEDYSSATRITNNVINGSMSITASVAGFGTIDFTDEDWTSNGTSTVAMSFFNAGELLHYNIFNKGTITNVSMLNAGTINSGTIKQDGRVARNILSYGTTFGGTAAAYATLVGSASVGSGTSTWVNDISVNNPNGNITCLVGFGTALSGSSVLLKGTFGTTSGVGQQKSYHLPVNAGMTNQDLVAYISGAGTIDVNVSYFISA